jgi:hypothetical protein
VRFVSYHRKSSPESRSYRSSLSVNSSMSSRNLSSGGEEEVVSDVRASGSSTAASVVSANTPSSGIDKSAAGDSLRNATKVEDMKTAWDLEKIERRGGPGPFEDRRWFCGWCGSTFKGWNATKALNHVSKASGVLE